MAGNKSLTHSRWFKYPLRSSKEAVNGSQLYQATSGISNGVNLLNSKIGKVGAGAAALAAIHPLDFDPDDKWNFAAGYGNYAGENAMALGAFYRPNEDTMFSVAGSMVTVKTWSMPAFL